MLHLRRLSVSAAGRRVFSRNAPLPSNLHCRGLLTLAIETSCDDTSVAIVNKDDTTGAAKIHFLKNITPNLTAYQGIHPILALESHQRNVAKLVNKALPHLPPPSSEHANNITKIIPLSDGTVRQKPDFISVTRGPGMRSNLFTGLDTAKGLAVAWQIPFIGVHHMQAHLLTPRLVSALALNNPTSDPESASASNDNNNKTGTPAFPFLSILASGGHTLLVTSTSLTTHKTMATTTDVALGEALDKAARHILPPSLLSTSKNTMYGKLLEHFAFPNGPSDYADYVAPQSRGDEIAVSKVRSRYGWSLSTPYAQTRELAFSFAFLATAVKDILTRASGNANVHSGSRGELGDEERRFLAREVMRVTFEHLASRTIIALESLCEWRAQFPRNPSDKRRVPVPESVPVKTLVVSGGVAANRFLMGILRKWLDGRGFGGLRGRVNAVL
ncbi:N(6)-L-threonylcarbamoyladenine synthase family protein [Aspergillus mulundensis]|uniref:N(6)-L-threonylcarbamoyladenine synthase n=1 Tax=Aspergillus mulundensis TaxID=1810919 RepID=A0A3D8QJ51_9EURO|nr:tRNA N6-adenosine threonylcarbamoyltransferase, mitochondrial [Aspergillus mulundensis]RDW61835.1 tRNA N6-adenosine threonylcarbamoyltransferase, mitochondrial [Aspergillus mulundensis]